MRKGATNTVLLIVGIMVLVVAGIFILSQQNATVAPEKQVSNGANGIIEGDGSGTNMQAIDVNIQKFMFRPDTLNVKKGTKVTWKNNDTIQHSITAVDGSFDSGLIGKNQTFSHTFNKAGTFEYFCTPHPKMKATITVE